MLCLAHGHTEQERCQSATLYMQVYIYINDSGKGVSASLLSGVQKQIHFACLGFWHAPSSLFTDALTCASQIKAHRVMCVIAMTVSLITVWT